MGLKEDVGRGTDEAERERLMGCSVLLQGLNREKREEAQTKL